MRRASNPSDPVMGCEERPQPSDVADAPLAEGKAFDFSGFVIVRLRPELGPGKADDLREVAKELGLRGLAHVLDGLGDAETSRLVTSVSTAELLRMEDEARKSEFGSPDSLTAYWRIDCQGDPRGMAELVDLLNQLPEVSLAYRELPVSAPVNPGDDCLSRFQGFLDSAPTGIDARWAWAQGGGDGAGVGFVDLEQGWLTTHEDLVAKNPTLIHNRNNPVHADHGTGVLGIVVGEDNDRGVVGVATGVTSVRMVSHFNGRTDLHVADAIAAATRVMARGDLLLLEVARGGQPNFPTEIDAGDRAAIRMASGNGIVVVEAAGNGARDLDEWTSENGLRLLNRGARESFVDSGAIMVGAGNSVLPHDRAQSSCFGSRVDCYAWGDGIYTCGRSGTAPFLGTTDTTSYTTNFGDTSGAAAIIAGAALILQAMHQHAGRPRLSPGEMRDALSGRATGTPQGAGRPGNIGVMPNLRAIAVDRRLVPDVYLRDAIGDAGVVPSTGAVSMSPDIIVRPAPVPDAPARFGEDSPTENVDTLGSEVQSGQDNTVYVRMRNRNRTVAAAVRATVYWSEVATLVTPGSWRLIGTTTPVPVPGNDRLVVSNGLTWRRDSLPVRGTHACFVAVLDDPRDAAPRIPQALDWNGFVNLVRTENNVAWRNFSIVDVVTTGRAHPMMLEFAIVGAPDEPRRFDFEILLKLPDDVDVRWDLGPAFASQLPARMLNGKDVVAKEDHHGLMLPRAPAVPICNTLLPARGRSRRGSSSSQAPHSHKECTASPSVRSGKGWRSGGSHGHSGRPPWSRRRAGAPRPRPNGNPVARPREGVDRRVREAISDSSGTRSRISS